MNLKYIKRLAVSLLSALTLAMSVSASAAAVPDDLVVENLNGQQRIVKTYELPPGTDPETLKEPSFEYDGFTYSWAYTTKEEHTAQKTKSVTETVTVETAKKDTNTILGQLSPTISYNDGAFKGELTLDHTTLSTVAAGYTTQWGTITDTKTIGPLDRNDMSYVPATTVKNGVTLTLSNVQWQVIGTDLVGEILAPAAYQAVATYSGSTSYQVATGYVTTAEYKGEVVSEGVESITYTVVYAGSEIVPEVVPEESDDLSGYFQLYISPIELIIGVVLLLAALVWLAVYLFRRRKNVYVYVPGDSPRDYKLVGKFRVEPQKPEIEVSEDQIGDVHMIAVEIKKPLAKKLLNQIFTVKHPYGTLRYMVLQDNPGDWHESVLDNPIEEEEEAV